MQFNAILCLCYNLMQFCAYATIHCNFAIITAFCQKKRFWTNILSNLMQFCVKVAIKCNFVYKLRLNGIFLKKGVFLFNTR